MSGSISRKRPWLAALLGLLFTGLGHLYLRRLRRGLGWFAAVVLLTILFVDAAALESLVAGRPVDPLPFGPPVALALISVGDAYLVARARNVLIDRTSLGGGERTHCPYCGNELDTDLTFCHWCTADLSAAERVSTGDEVSESDEAG